METVQRLLRNLFIEVGSDEPLRDMNYQPLSPAMVELLKSPLGLFENTLTIYYPIGRYGEFEPAPVTYQVTPETTAWTLVEAIRDVYKQPITESTIRAYMEKFPAHNIFLGRSNVTLKDLMFGATYIKELIPYNGGYLLKLTG